jgi:hypothetical protein
MSIELQNTTVLDGLNNAAIQSPQRMTYQAQVDVIQRQIGGIEDVRNKLGLSARRICQLLLVDPSAWSRWTRSPSGPPAHVWRALQWYMILNEKIPGLTPDYFVGRNPIDESHRIRREMDQKVQALEKGQVAWSLEQRQVIQNLQFEIASSRKLESELRDQIREFQTKIRKLVRVGWLAVGLAGGVGILLFLMLFLRGL